MFVGLNLNGKIYFIASLATETNKLDPIGKLGPFNLVCFLLGCLLLHEPFSTSFPRQTDVSNSRSYRDVNRCNADVSLFGRLHSIWVLWLCRLNYVPMLTAAMSQGFRNLSESEREQGKYRSQTDLRSASSA